MLHPQTDRQEPADIFEAVLFVFTILVVVVMLAVIIWFAVFIGHVSL